MLNFKFLKSAKIRKRSEYQPVFKANKRLYSRFFTLYYRLNSLDTGRLGVVVGKAHARLSVSRNRIKRIVREEFRLSQHELKGIDIVLVAKKSVSEDLNNELRPCLIELLKQLRTQVKKS